MNPESLSRPIQVDFHTSVIGTEKSPLFTSLLLSKRSPSLKGLFFRYRPVTKITYIPINPEGRLFPGGKMPVTRPISDPFP
ncbi:hypothetical protein OPIT5_00240 (plasmid) [Opitutaceae bacterium TAV5]|nr:hypothetical protein OPIT5_00240 [Opitutaceae bacterium TAV5]